MRRAAERCPLRRRAAARASAVMRLMERALRSVLSVSSPSSISCPVAAVPGSRRLCCLPNAAPPPAACPATTIPAALTQRTSQLQTLKRRPPIPFAAAGDSASRSGSPVPQRAASPASPQPASPGATVRAPRQQSPLPPTSSDARPLAGRGLPSAAAHPAAPLLAKHSAPPALSGAAAASAGGMFGAGGGANMRAAAAPLPSPTSATAVLQQARQASASGMSDTSQSGGAALAQLGHYVSPCCATG